MCDKQVPVSIKNSNLSQIKVIALGDSITFGFPYAPSDSWVNLVQEQLEAKFKSGKSGLNENDQLARYFNAIHGDIENFSDADIVNEETLIEKIINPLKVL